MVEWRSKFIFEVSVNSKFLEGENLKARKLSLRNESCFVFNIFNDGILCKDYHHWHACAPQQTILFLTYFTTCLIFPFSFLYSPFFFSKRTRLKRSQIVQMYIHHMLLRLRGPHAPLDGAKILSLAIRKR